MWKYVFHEIPLEFSSVFLYANINNLIVFSFLQLEINLIKFREVEQYVWNIDESYRCCFPYHFTEKKIHQTKGSFIFQ